MNAPSSAEQQKLIFLIEDDVDLAGILMDYLQEYGLYQVIWSDSGSAAFKAMQHIQPDLLVIDYLLPSINGLEFYDLIGKRPEYAHIPSILITANPQRLGLEAEQRKIRVLEKPFDLDTFLQVIKTLLAGYRFSVARTIGDFTRLLRDLNTEAQKTTR